MSALQIDEAAISVPNLPLPEMTYPANHITINHTQSGFQYTFSALEALRGVHVGEGWEEKAGGGVKVKHAEDWSKTRIGHMAPAIPSAGSTSSDPSSSSSSLFDSSLVLPTTPTKPFDWTYSTQYYGHIPSSSTTKNPGWKPSDPEEPEDNIPMGELSRTDVPILFYDEVPLFESELDDNGDSALATRVRVMPDSAFILCRLFIRVDGVLFRLFDTRLFVSLTKRSIIRETSGWEADWDSVKGRLPPPSTDLTPLTTSHWVAAQLTSKRPPAKVKSVTGGPWKGLRKRVEILKLPAEHINEPVEDSVLAGVAALRVAI